METSGLKDNDVDKIRKILESYPKVERAILYGSRAKEDYKPWSDIDLTLLGKDLNLSLVHRIEEDLDNLLLPYKFDISIFEQISNPDLVEHIERAGKVFYAISGK